MLNEEKNNSGDSTGTPAEKQAVFRIVGQPGILEEHGLWKQTD